MTPEKKISLDDYLKARKNIVDEALDRYLPGEDTFPSTIFKSVRYSVFAGGKRLRPILCMASAEAVGGNIETVLPVACALELIHTYSLIHDDLPVIDDDDYRRGKPTNHKVFGEDIAILAGDALLTEAFRLMSKREFVGETPPDRLLAVISDISEAAGFLGMVGGQVVDVQSEGKEVGEETLDYIHTHKTGAMITTSVRAGAVLSGAGKNEIDALSDYGRNIGLAFQIADDILDVEGDQETLGKDIGSDRSRGKVTFPALFGLEASRKKARELVDNALSDIAQFDSRAEPLRMIAKYIIERRS
ncbi:MAG: polyprenyl synthetase family protein [Syntrophales bacterium]|nr:polyprenyl synthetase family protein [Syntrophales bacterium]